MRILIAGGFGFVGGRIAQQLSGHGHQVILGTRSSSAPRAWLPNSQTAGIKWDDPTGLERICADVDVVIHAAGMNAEECAADPAAALMANGVATVRFLNAAIRAGVKRFLYISTAHVYGSPLEGVITESSCPRNLHPYATSHLAGEYAVLESAEKGRIEGIVFRLSNAFGAPMHSEVKCWKLLANDLCRQAVESRNLVLRSAGTQLRDFVTLQDVACATEHLVCLEAGGQGGVFNVGSGRSESVNDMAALVQSRCLALFGYEPPVSRPVGSSGRTIEGPTHLEYQIARLKSTGFSLANAREEEIDQLLLFCRRHFASA